MIEGIKKIREAFRKITAVLRDGTGKHSYTGSVE